MQISYSIRLPFEVSQVYGKTIAVNAGVVVFPLTLKTIVPKMNGQELKSIEHKDFPIMEISGSGALYLKIIHEDKSAFTSTNMVPIIRAEIIFDEESNTDTETTMKIAELEFDEDTGFLSIDQLLRSDVYPLIFGTL